MPMRTDPDGLPHRDDRQALSAALRSVLAELWPGADPDTVAAIGALAASRFFGVRFRAEGGDGHAWVTRRPNPDICEIWDPSALGLVWDFQNRLPAPDRYRATPEAAGRIAGKAQAAMTRVGEMARRTHALALGVEPDEV